MKPTVHIGLTDIIDNISIIRDETPIKKTDSADWSDLDSKRKCKKLVEIALLSFYHYHLTGEWLEIETIKDLPVFEDVDVILTYDLGRLL